ncbi:MAG: peptidylprolyl isomerase [Gammaproteobacteria bacterium]|nr:MAG: peptidylprolyl isomerase [Gammaproteobacteria bacterium]
MHNITKLAAISLIALLPLTACSGDDAENNTVAAPKQNATEQKAPDTAKDAPKPDANADTNTPAPEKTIVAVVNGTQITQLMLDKHVEYRTRGKKVTLTAEQRKAVIDDIISLELLKQDAIKNNLDKDAGLVAVLENVKRGELAQVNVNKIKEQGKTSEESIKKQYDEYVKNNALDFNASHILVKTEEEAKNVIKEIDGGAVFAEAAKKYSVGPTGVKGGALGWFGANQMVPEFTAAVKKLAVGAYTKEPVKTKFGWHVILLQETRPANVPPYEQMKKQLQMKAETDLIQNTIAELKKNAKIEITE